MPAATSRPPPQSLHMMGKRAVSASRSTMPNGSWSEDSAKISNALK